MMVYSLPHLKSKRRFQRKGGHHVQGCFHSQFDCNAAIGNDCFVVHEKI